LVSKNYRVPSYRAALAAWWYAKLFW